MNLDRYIQCRPSQRSQYFSKLRYAIILLFVIHTLILASCTWRQVGCASGATLAYAATVALLDQDEEKRIKRGKKTLSKAEKAAITAIASSVGCMIGSEIAGGIETYVRKKREEYKTEAAFLQAHIDDLKRSVKKADEEIAWLNIQASKIEQESKNVKNLPAFQSAMSSELKKAAKKRKKDAERLATYLSAARNDSMNAYRSSSDPQRKMALKKNIAELDARIDRTKEVTRKIINAESKISYV